MKILFLSWWFPYPPNNGSKIRVYNLLRELSKRHELILLSFAEPGEATAADQQALLAYTKQIEVVPKPIFHSSGLKALAGFFSLQPRSFVATYRTEMEILIKKMAQENRFDAVIASEIDTAPYALALEDIPKILDELQLTVLYEQFARQSHLLKKLRSWLTWVKLSRYITRLLQKYDGCTVVSNEERRRVSELAPDNFPVCLVPNGVDINFFTNGTISPQPDTLIYSGALTFGANFEAIDFFLRDVFPLIQAKRPGVKLFITGKTEGVSLERLPINEHVVFTGYLDDVRPTVARSWVSIIPLRIGGGTRLKILEALALGTPVVATSKGAEGLDLVPGRDLLIADTPADFAAAVLRLLQDPDLHETLRRNGRQAVEVKYDWQMIGRQIGDFIETIVTSYL